MTIETNIMNRRELAGALAQYMNTCAVYLGPPTFAYPDWRHPPVE